ncbi:hypothetical protein LCGC14_1576390 [marine sediment metagenome]|uniref:LysM domain-containing protein n=1 Tax=marine sediment metagenome TaxID=412755 RepID=A0A0F9J4C1_9ZZZZ
MARYTSKIKDLAISAAHRHGVPVSVLLGTWKVESGFDPQALGDLNKDGAPYSFGLGQLHVKGAGHGFHPRKLLLPEFNANLSAQYLASCYAAFADNDRLAVSAYNQGIAGAKERGEKINKAYVDSVFAAAQEFTELDAKDAAKPEPRTYTVKGADNLWKIASKFYGDGRQWEIIYAANKETIGPDPDLIQPGQVLTIP